MLSTITNLKHKILIAALFLVLFQSAQAQTFIKNTDPNNPINQESFAGNYFGTAWIDFNNDRLLDLYINRKAVFKNTGGGNFEKIQGAMGDQPQNLGNSWADFNNDGFIDNFVISTGAITSFLNKNVDGTSTVKILTGDIGDSAFNTGWGCAWADYNNDGYVDIVLSAASVFGIVNHPNRFYVNNGNETFARTTVPGLTDTIGPFTIPTWSDFDQDGDQDLFIGTGPGGSASFDYFYKNVFTETGTAGLVRMNLAPMTTDMHDGQVWNWIDYDNDGDLDAFVTNYSSLPNQFYRNNNGTYERLTAEQVGNIVSETGGFLTNLWADFDNDGDLDCFITRDVPRNARYYSNNNDGTFTRIDTMGVTTIPGGNFGATAGDYDNNGTMDLYVTGTNTSHGLFKNELSNGNKWINIKCVGGGAMANLSNRSAVGTKVKAKATINGLPVWQFREVSAQNAFNSANMLNVHFGFGNAAVLDSLVIIWPRGMREVFTNVSLNSFYTATEGQGIVSGISNGFNEVPREFRLEQNFPNPFNPVTRINYELINRNHVTLKVFDNLGKEVMTLVNQNQPAGNYEVAFDGEGLSSGVYFYKLSAGGFSETKRMMLLK